MMLLRFTLVHQRLQNNCHTQLLIGNWNELISNRNDKIAANYPEASNNPYQVSDSAIDLKVGKSYLVINADNDPHYDDEELSSDDRTRMNSSTESYDNSKMESSESSLRNVVIYILELM